MSMVENGWWIYGFYGEAISIFLIFEHFHNKVVKVGNTISSKLKNNIGEKFPKYFLLIYRINLFQSKFSKIIYLSMLSDFSVFCHPQQWDNHCDSSLLEKYLP